MNKGFLKRCYAGFFEGKSVMNESFFEGKRVMNDFFFFMSYSDPPRTVVFGQKSNKARQSFEREKSPCTEKIPYTGKFQTLENRAQSLERGKTPVPGRGGCKMRFFRGKMSLFFIAYFDPNHKKTSY